MLVTGGRQGASARRFSGRPSRGRQPSPSEGLTSMFHSTFRRLAPLCLALLTTFGFAQAPVAPTAPAPVQEQEPADPSSADVWQGAIEIAGMPLEVTIRLNPEAAGWQGSIDIPAQGATDMPIA